MPSWDEIKSRINSEGKSSPYNLVRKEYISALSEITGRNTIIYYSAFLQKALAPNAINDRDMAGFMSVLNRVDDKKGLDLVLHTSGGGIAATEAIVNYLIAKFKTDIRVIVPQLAMSAGTLIACAGKMILMGKHSSLGPIDPQLGDFSVFETLKEFERAYDEIKKDKNKVYVWQPIISQYSPGLISECEQALAWSKYLATKWLQENMLKNHPKKAERIGKKLTDKDKLYAHDRHINVAYAKRLGLKIKILENNQKLQDAVLSVHHATMCTLSDTTAYKIIENDRGMSYIQSIPPMQQKS